MGPPERSYSSATAHGEVAIATPSPFLCGDHTPSLFSVYCTSLECRRVEGFARLIGLMDGLDGPIMPAVLTLPAKVPFSTCPVLVGAIWRDAENAQCRRTDGTPFMVTWT
jgi:hypothetical protein